MSKLYLDNYTLDLIIISCISIIFICIVFFLYSQYSISSIKENMDSKSKPTFKL